MRKKENSIFSIYDLLGITIFKRLRLQFGHLNEVETTEHFLLRLYSPQRLELFETLEKVDSFINLNVKDKVSFLLYSSQSATSKSSNHEILKFVINYIKETGRFDRPLFCSNQRFLDFFFFRYVPIDSLSIDTFQILRSCAAFIVSACLY